MHATGFQEALTISGFLTCRVDGSDFILLLVPNLTLYAHWWALAFGFLEIAG